MLINISLKKMLKGVYTGKDVEKAYDIDHTTKRQKSLV